MRHESFLGALAIAGAAILGACYSGNAGTQDNGGSGAAGTGGSAGSGGEAGNAGTGGGGGGGSGTDCLPPDVALFLATNCLSCHGHPPTGGAPQSLVTLAELQAPDVNDPSISTAMGSLQRMQKGEMPPGGGVSADDISLFATWVGGGAQAVSCGGTGGAGGSGGGAGAGGAGGTGGTGGNDPYNTPTTCTSGKTWTHGNSGSSSMNPGQACIACHQSEGEGPYLTIAGTVYPTAHEPNNCNGIGGVQVVVMDASHNPVFSINTNSVGNFRSSTTPPQGWHVKVTSANGERAMSATPATGDCNTCHTEQGTNSAPGRIMAP